MDTQETAIIRKRLRINDVPLKRACAKYLAFAKGVQNPSTETEECNNLREGLERELRMNEVIFSKSRMVWQTNLRELEHYDQLYKERENAIHQVQAEIEALKQELQEEKIKRKYKDEYDTLAKIINEHPSRAETLREIAKEKAELESIGKDTEDIALKLALRSKQFQLILCSLEELQQMLTEEEKEVKETGLIEDTSTMDIDKES